MTNKELIHRNIGLTFDFVKFLIDNPEMIDEIPARFELDFLDKDFVMTIKSGKYNGNKKHKYIKVKKSFEITEQNY